MDEQIRSVIFDVVLKAAVKNITAAVPILSWPVINPIVNFVILKIATILYDQLALYVKFTLIDFKTDQEQRAYTKAVEEFKTIQKAPAATPEEKNHAKENFKRALGDLIRFAPS